jgi:hypothetical protein
MRREGVSEIRKKFEAYVRLLKEEFSQGLILPTKDAIVKTSSTTNGSSTVSPQAVAQAEAPKEQAKQLINACKIETKKLKLVEEFKCRVNELYQVFTDINVCRNCFFLKFNLIDF